MAKGSKVECIGADPGIFIEGGGGQNIMHAHHERKAIRPLYGRDPVPA